MGSASSKTIADHFTNATAGESASTTQDSVCNAYCGNVINISANRAARDQVVTVDGNDQSCQIHCKAQSHMTSLIEQQIDQNIISQIKQESTAKIKGINLLNFSSAVAQANQTTNASIKTAANIDQKCLINMMGSNIINISGNRAGRDQTVTVTGQKQKTALDGIIECGLDSSVYQAESQQLKIMTTQKASASTIGVDPIGLLIALLVAFLVTFVGPVIMPVIAIKMLKSTIGELAPVAVLAFVITIVCLIVSIYFFVRYYGQLNESHSQSSSWNPSSAPDLYQEMKVQVQDPSSDQIKWLPEPEGSGHNLFITPYSTMGHRTYPSDDSETAVISGPTPIWKSGILNSEIPEYSSIWADAIPDYDVIIYDPTGSTRVPAINPSTDYQGPIQIKTEDDYENPQKLATWLNLHPEYISFEWFGYYIDSVSRDMIKLNNPVIVLHRSLPEGFWNWDSIEETLCLTCVESDATDETDETDAPDEDASKAAQACKGVWGKCHGKIKQQSGQLPGDTGPDVKLEPRMNYTDNIEFINDFYPTWDTTDQPNKCGINISKPDEEGNKPWGGAHFIDVPMNQGFNTGTGSGPLCSDGGIGGGIGQLNTEDFGGIDGYETAKTAFRAAKTAQAQGPTAGIDATGVPAKDATTLKGELNTARQALEEKVAHGIAAKYAVNPLVNQVFDFSTSTNDINLWSKVEADDQHTFARATEAGYCNVTTEQRTCGTPGSRRDFNVRCFPSGALPSGDSVTVAKDTLTADGVGDKCKLNTDLNICEKKEPICADVGPTIMCGANESSWTDWSKKNVLNPYKPIVAPAAGAAVPTGCNALLNNENVLTQDAAKDAITACQAECCVGGSQTLWQDVAEFTMETFEVLEMANLVPLFTANSLVATAFDDENFADTFKDQYENAAAALEASNRATFGENADETPIVTSGREVYDVKCDWSDSAVQTDVQFYPRTPIWPNTTGIKMFRDGSEMDPYWFPLSARSYIYIKVSLAAIVAFCAVFSLIMQVYHGDGSSSTPS